MGKSKLATRTKIIIALFVVVSAALLILGVRAAVNSSVFEGEDASLTNATTQEDESSSGGSFVEFNGQDEPSDDEPTGEPAEASTATYKVTIDIAWSEATHASTLPGGAHTSPAVVLAHNEAGGLYKVGEVVSDGLEQVAETGATSIVVEELTPDLPYEDALAIGKRVDAPGADDSITMTLNSSTPLLSLLTMLAPSPDWLIGAADIALYNTDTEEWADSTTVELSAYDAGTDNGATFTADDIDASPRVTLGIPIDPVFVEAAKTPFGSVTIERINE